MSNNMWWGEKRAVEKMSQAAASVRSQIQKWKCINRRWQASMAPSEVYELSHRPSPDSPVPLREKNWASGTLYSAGQLDTFHLRHWHECVCVCVRGHCPLTVRSVMIYVLSVKLLLLSILRLFGGCRWFSTFSKSPGACNTKSAQLSPASLSLSHWVGPG